MQFNHKPASVFQLAAALHEGPTSRLAPQWTAPPVYLILNKTDKLDDNVREVRSNLGQPFVPGGTTAPLVAGDQVLWAKGSSWGGRPRGRIRDKGSGWVRGRVGEVGQEGARGKVRGRDWVLGMSRGGTE